MLKVQLYRYLYQFHHAGILNSARGSNVKEECKKIKSVTKIAADVSLTFHCNYRRRLKLLDQLWGILL